VVPSAARRSDDRLLEATEQAVCVAQRSPDLCDIDQPGAGRHATLLEQIEDTLGDGLRVQRLERRVRRDA
jgi:hypothetical protein